MLALLMQADCLDNGLARTPALGYNTWNAFGGNSVSFPIVLEHICASQNIPIAVSITPCTFINVATVLDLNP